MKNSAAIKPVPKYARFLPKPARAKPYTPFQKLSFVRPHGSFGGFSAWDPPQATEAVLKKVFADDEMQRADFEGFAKDSWIHAAEYAIGCEIGNRSAREWIAYLKKSWRGDVCNSTLPSIVGHMLGWPEHNEQKRGAAIAFFTELEDLIGAALAQGKAREPAGRRTRRKSGKVDGPRKSRRAKRVTVRVSTSKKPRKKKVAAARTATG